MKTKLLYIALSLLIGNAFAATTDADFNIEDNKELRLHDATGVEYIALKSPATLAGTLTLTLPATTGASAQVLTTDGSGVLSWTTPSGITLTNDLVTNSTSTALTAAQGKILKDLVDAIPSSATALTYAGTTLTYTTNNGTSSDIDLSNLADNVNISNGAFSSATSVVTLTKSDGSTLSFSLADLLTMANDRSSHTGSQTASTISDFATTVNAAIAVHGSVTGKINTADISTDTALGTATGVVVSQSAIKSYVDSSIGSATLSVYQFNSTASATVNTITSTILTASSVTITGGKKVYISFNAPYKASVDTSGGMAVGLFAKLNDGNWINLGSSGYTDEGSSLQTKFRRVVANEYVFDFVTNESLLADTDYTLEVVLRARASNGSVEVNPSDVINDSLITDPGNETLAVKGWAGNKNFVNLTIKEL